MKNTAPLSRTFKNLRQTDRGGGEKESERETDKNENSYFAV